MCIYKFSKGKNKNQLCTVRKNFQNGYCKKHFGLIKHKRVRACGANIIQPATSHSQASDTPQDPHTSVNTDVVDTWENFFETTSHLSLARDKDALDNIISDPTNEHRESVLKQVGDDLNKQRLNLLKDSQRTCSNEHVATDAPNQPYDEQFAVNSLFNVQKALIICAEEISNTKHFKEKYVSLSGLRDLTMKKETEYRLALLQIYRKYGTEISRFIEPITIFTLMLLSDVSTVAIINIKAKKKD